MHCRTLPQTNKEAASENKSSRHLQVDGKNLGSYTRGKTGEEIWRYRTDKSLSSPPALTDERKTVGHRKWKKEGEKETGRGGDSRESEVVPVWREKALCSLSVDRPVKLRRAQGHRPEGFTGLCSFLCGSSVSTTATTDPPAPAWCPLPVQLHGWLQAMKAPPPCAHFTVNSYFYRKWIRGLQSHFHFPPQPKR